MHYVHIKFGDCRILRLGDGQHHTVHDLLLIDDSRPRVVAVRRFLCQSVSNMEGRHRLIQSWAWAWTNSYLRHFLGLQDASHCR